MSLSDMSLSDYIENYYMTIMNIDKTVSVFSDFINVVKNLENSKSIDNTLLDSYQNMVAYIKKDTNKDINLHFNRMRYHVQLYFSKFENFPILPFF